MAPVLVVVNGAPATGKTTVAAAWAAAHAGWQAIDVDELKVAIAGWQDDPGGAGLASRATALDTAAHLLERGTSVIVSQLYGLPEPLDDLERLGAAHGARFVELVLRGDRELLRRRFLDRGGVQLEMARDLGFDALYDRVEAILVARPDTLVVDVDDLDLGGLLAAVARAIEGEATR